MSKCAGEFRRDWNEEIDEPNQSNDNLVKQMEEEIQHYKNQLQIANNELKTQRGKNDDLRSKNWKAMEALSNSERMYQKTQKSQANSKKQSTPAQSRLNSKQGINKIRNEAEQTQRTFLVTLFEDVIDVKDSKLDTKDHKEWLNTFAEKVNIWKNEITKCEINKTNETNDVMDATIDKLKVQVSHLEHTLQETEKMLHQLQSTVEIEEAQWKIRLSKKEAELEEAREETENLINKNYSLHESLKVVRSAETMEKQIKELQRNLSNEEIKQKEMSAIISQASETHLMEKKDLVAEVETLRTDMEMEKRSSTELEGKISQMNNLISTGQQALQEEQSAVELLKEQISKLNNNLALSMTLVPPKDNSSTTEVPESKAVGQVESISSLINLAPDGSDLNVHTSPPQNKAPVSRNNTLKKKKKKKKHVF